MNVHLHTRVHEPMHDITIASNVGMSTVYSTRNVFMERGDVLDATCLFIVVKHGSHTTIVAFLWLITNKLTLGALGSEAQSLFKEVAHRVSNATSEPRSHEFLLQRGAMRHLFWVLQWQG